MTVGRQINSALVVCIWQNPYYKKYCQPEYYCFYLHQEEVSPRLCSEILYLRLHSQSYSVAPCTLVTSRHQSAIYLLIMPTVLSLCVCSSEWADEKSASLPPEFIEFPFHHLENADLSQSPDCSNLYAKCSSVFLKGTNGASLLQARPTLISQECYIRREVRICSGGVLRTYNSVEVVGAVRSRNKVPSISHELKYLFKYSEKLHFGIPNNKKRLIIDGINFGVNSTCSWYWHNTRGIKMIY